MFGRRKDGQYYRKDAIRTVHVSSGRHYTQKEKDRLRTLENPLLFANFVKKLEELNPDFDIEEIDRSLEPEEALMDLKRKHQELDIGLWEGKHEGFREFLDEMGITNEKVQNLVAQQDSPLSEEELQTLSYVLNGRSDHAVKVDEALKAPQTSDVRRWMSNSNRLDLKGLKY